MFWEKKHTPIFYVRACFKSLLNISSTNQFSQNKTVSGGRVSNIPHSYQIGSQNNMQAKFRRCNQAKVHLKNETTYSILPLTLHYMKPKYKYILANRNNLRIVNIDSEFELKNTHKKR